MAEGPHESWYPLKEKIVRGLDERRFANLHDKETGLIGDEGRRKRRGSITGGWITTVNPSFVCGSSSPEGTIGGGVLSRPTGSEGIPFVKRTSYRNERGEGTVHHTRVIYTQPTL